MKNSKIQEEDLRLASRHPTEFIANFVHRRLGEGKLKVANLSAQGCMIENCPEIGRGERLEVAFPIVGRMDCHVVWQRDERAGLQFERIIRLDDFMALLKVIGKQHTRRLR